MQSATDTSCIGLLLVEKMVYIHTVKPVSKHCCRPPPARLCRKPPWEQQHHIRQYAQLWATQTSEQRHTYTHITARLCLQGWCVRVALQHNTQHARQSHRRTHRQEESGCPSLNTHARWVCASQKHTHGTNAPAMTARHTKDTAVQPVCLHQEYQHTPLIMGPHLTGAAKAHRSARAQREALSDSSSSCNSSCRTGTAVHTPRHAAISTRQLPVGTTAVCRQHGSQSLCWVHAELS